MRQLELTRLRTAFPDPAALFLYQHPTETPQYRQMQAKRDDKE
jgi:hypothetical protein